MATFDLELRVQTFGSVITWEILLEDATNHNQRVRDWLQADGYRYKLLPGYAVEGNLLTIFAGCQGITGATLSCEVLINGLSQPLKLTAKAEENQYAKADYLIT